VRESTRTDRESDQQHGVSLTYSGGRWRTELMLVLGNFQLNPDRYRERGYALTRYADGVLMRWGPSTKFSLLGEIDVLKEGGRRAGFTGFLQADYEPWRGFHFLVTGEVLDQGLLNRPGVLPVRGSGAPRYGAWLGLNWFPLEHLELRVDGVMHQDDVFHGQAQLHLYL
jgi:hypothetical protein